MPALTVTRRCADLAELLSSGAAGLGAVAVLSADLPGLDREAVQHLHGSGVWVLALADDDAGWPHDRVERLGADVVVAASEAADLAPAIAALLARSERGLRPGRGEAGSRGSSRSVVTEPEAQAERGGAGAVRAPGACAGVAGASASESGPVGPQGVLVAVWGPTGAPGRTTVALNLAAELATSVPGGALLVDADTYGGTVAQTLGLLDESPGIAAACRAASTGRLDPVSLAAMTPLVEPGLRVLTGIGRADRWPEVPPASLEMVWATARRLAPWVVVDCGFNLEQDELLSYDTRAPGRNGATLSALAEADVVVVVGGGDPVALQRLVRALGDLSDAGVTGERLVVVNRVRASASGPRPADAIREALRRYAGITDAHLLPDDAPTCDAALLGALTLREQAPGSPVRRALVDLAGALLSARAPVRAH